MVLLLFQVLLAKLINVMFYIVMQMKLKKQKIDFLILKLGIKLLLPLMYGLLDKH